MCSSDLDYGWLVRCRNCPGCLRARRFQWSLRAEWEIVTSTRTWFFTGTFANQYHDREIVGEAMTRFLKRLRKRAVKNGGNFRYLVCPERHKSGAWHYHGLFHDDYQVLSYRDIKRSWTDGFSYPKLVDTTPARAAQYVTKYATKDLLEEDGGGKRVRIRASRDPKYGAPVIIEDLELVQEIMNARGDERLDEVWIKNLKMMLARDRTTMWSKSPEQNLKRILMQTRMRS